MPISKIKDKIFWGIKLIGAIIIFYLGVNYGVLPVGERLTDLMKDYLQETRISILETGFQFTGNLAKEYIDEAMDEIFNETGHGAANIEDVYKKRMETICFSDFKLCGKIDRKGDFTFKEKYLYLSSIFNIVRFLKNNMVIGNDIVDELNQITVDNSIGNRRGYATWSNIVLNLGSVNSRIEFVQLVTHEIGHIVDLGSIQGTSSRMHGAFTEFGRKVFANDDLSLDYYAISWKSETIRKPGVAKKDFCSGYGMTDPFEDFAECFNLYINHNALFKAIAKNNKNLKSKYNFIANMVDGNYLSSNSDDLVYVKNNVYWRPWDTTRINN